MESCTNELYLSNTNKNQILIVGNIKKLLKQLINSIIIIDTIIKYKNFYINKNSTLMTVLNYN